MTGRSLGRNAKFFVMLSGSFPSGSWTEVPQISDMTRNVQWDEGEANSRESAAKMGVKTLGDFSVGGKLKFVRGDATIAAIMDALMSPDAVLPIMCLNGSNTAAGNYGVAFDSQVFQGNEDQGLGAVVYEDLMFKPTPNGNSPYSVKVVGSAPVFTAI